ncbi:MAG: ABC transporter permease [Candidatus Krumholzibacteriota bacterium]|nr:ABC transporter permease [Candidatus Krumholzibacteriota bacterium]
MIRTLRNLVGAQFKEYFREPEIIFWAMIFPILLSWLLGIAIGSGGKSVAKVAVVSGAEAPADSDVAWVDSLTAEAGTKLIPLSKDEALLALKKGKVSLLVERSQENTLLYHFDPRNSEAERTWLLMERAAARHWGEERESSIAPLDMPGTRYIDFLVPGLLAMSIMNSAMWGVGWSLIELRMKKLLRRMAATPVNKELFLGSYFVTRLVTNGIQFLALYIFVHIYFGVRIQGSIPALAAVFVAGNLAFSGVAVLISSRTANSRVGNGLINAITLPMMLLSGIFFSYHNFPAWAVPVVQKLPLTMLTDSMRTIFNEGTGLAGAIGPVAALSAVGIVLIYAGTKMFRWY